MTLETDHPLALSPSRPGWRELWANWRNARLANPSFQRWAAAFPFTRPIAQKRSRELFDLVGGFVYSQILFALIETRIVEALSKGARDFDSILPVSGLPDDGLRRLLDAAVPLRLIETVAPDRYALGDLGGALVANPGVIAMIRHHALFYRDLADPVGLLKDSDKETELGAFWAYAKQDHGGILAAKDVAAYSDLMAISQQFIANEILDAYSLSSHRRLLDIGGGQGAFVSAAAERYAGLKFDVFDLPPVADRANEGFQQAGIQGRATAHGGDLFADPLPVGADIASLIRVLYDHDDDAARIILKKAYNALPEGGTLLISEPMAQTTGAETVGASYFGFYLLAMRSGASRSATQLSTLIEEAGFGKTRRLKSRSPLLTSVLVSQK